MQEMAAPRAPVAFCPGRRMLGAVLVPGQGSDLNAPARNRAGGDPDVGALGDRYRAVLTLDTLRWDSNYEGLQMVGRGGQGVVFRCERTGVDGFALPVALKVFSPAVYPTVADYESDMRRMASVAMRMARLQNHHLLDVHNFIVRDGIRILVMEWVNGYDLGRLLSSEALAMARSSVSALERIHLDEVVVTEGPQRARLKPGIAIEILRECLDGLASLHRAGVAHGDLKPSNVMVKRTGSVKLVDFGSAVEMGEPDPRVAATPAYAAPEVLDGEPNSPQSDLASLGYLLVEMLSGRVLFDRSLPLEQLKAEKGGLIAKLPEVLPSDVMRNDDLVALCSHLVHPDPRQRMASAEEANIVWAANLHRQLVKTDLDSEYENDLRIWMESLPSARPLPAGGDLEGSATPVEEGETTQLATQLVWPIPGSGEVERGDGSG